MKSIFALKKCRFSLNKITKNRMPIFFDESQQATRVERKRGRNWLLLCLYFKCFCEKYATITFLPLRCKRVNHLFLSFADSIWCFVICWGSRVVTCDSKIECDVTYCVNFVDRSTDSAVIILNFFKMSLQIPSLPQHIESLE